MDTETKEYINKHVKVIDMKIDKILRDIKIEFDGIKDRLYNVEAGLDSIQMGSS